MRLKPIFLSILALALLCVPVLGETDITAEVVNASYAIITGIEDIISPQPEIPKNTPYIYQGDTVYLDTVVDISGVVPPYPQLAYWDGYDMYDSPPKYNITLPDSKKGYYHFYIDPEIFETRTGWWFKYDGEYEKQGNNRAFKVSKLYSHDGLLTYPNGTVVNITIPESDANYTEHYIQPEILPERHISDYVVARGDSITVEDNKSRVWVFGYKDGIYDHASVKGEPTNTIPSDEIYRLEPGDYKMIVHTPGPNTIFEAQNISFNLTPGLYGKTPVNFKGMAAPVVYQKFTQMLTGTDDVLREYKLELKEPYITIAEANEIHKEGIDVLEVRGYTNVANGTTINVTLDDQSTTYKNYWVSAASTRAIRTSPGNLSIYQAYVPFDYNDLAADSRNHTLTAKTALGGSIQVSFKIGTMPVDSYRPNATMKYMENGNPFIPTPTPEIRTVTVERTVRVVERVTIPVTPSNEQVKIQQDAVINEKIILFGAVGFGAFALLAMLAYMYSVYRRGRNKG